MIIRVLDKQSAKKLLKRHKKSCNLFKKLYNLEKKVVTLS